MDLKEFYDIYGMWHVPWWQRTFVVAMFWFVLAFFVLFFSYLLIRYWLRRKKYCSPWQEALYALSEGKRIWLSDVNNYTLFYAGTLRILKRYLWRRFNFDLMAATDDEMVGFLKKSTEVPQRLVPEISDFIMRAELVRFADAQVSSEAAEKDYVCLVRLIEATIPSESR